MNSQPTKSERLRLEIIEDLGKQLNVVQNSADDRVAMLWARRRSPSHQHFTYQWSHLL
ncbi:MAG: hypothetical protein K2X77_09095 [Candidatus Obscuribacterales bacterium]|nr:hypothetical protein [Candidatus Obscuribacterales bacterium]